MATTIPNAQTLLNRYPAVDPRERAALVAWVRGLRPAALVALLADRRAESKLLEIRANEPELEADGRWIGLVLGATLAAGAAALLAAGLLTAA
ncbi:MAG TPA: hypothetical protein VEZ48_00705 [Sphingomonadaceae bacterium]|jgi:hypothetical protein|nr:hypothetical protein [Sphingomonadaceae bacterium]